MSASKATKQLAKLSIRADEINSSCKPVIAAFWKSHKLRSRPTIDSLGTPRSLLIRSVNVL